MPENAKGDMCPSTWLHFISSGCYLLQDDCISVKSTALIESFCSIDWTKSVGINLMSTAASDMTINGEKALSRLIKNENNLLLLF